MNCRHCNASLTRGFLDLGFAPPSNSYVIREHLSDPEVCYPLRVQVCDHCWLVQTEDYTKETDLFTSDYAYFSSTSKSWLAHAAKYCDKVIRDLGLDEESFVVEVASNDGYLLKNFVMQRIPCLGVEPTDDTARAAELLGVPVVHEFFGQAVAEKLSASHGKADLVIGNNVFAHVPDINDFAHGLAVMLKPSGTITLEFPHLMQLIKLCQFDTIYHEHFSYLSLYTVGKIFNGAGLRIYDVEELTSHGGSLRVYGCHKDADIETTSFVSEVLSQEEKMGLRKPQTYESFQASADKIKDDLLMFLINCKKQGKSVAAYGAAAKGNTLLNYAGVKKDLLPFVCDAAASKQGKYLPGSHIPIFAPEVLKENAPDYVLVLPWNLLPEIREQLGYLTKHNTKFVIAVPELEIV